MLWKENLAETILNKIFGADYFSEITKITKNQNLTPLGEILTKDYHYEELPKTTAVASAL